MQILESFNWYGTYTLCRREILRFLKVYHQTLIGPAISALLFLTVFMLSVGENTKEINGIKYINFIGYGLIMMSIVQNAFFNTSSSLIVSKIVGNIIDILTVPLGGTEIITAFCIGGIIRGVVIGILVYISFLPFIDFTLYHPLMLIYITLSSTLFMSMLGIFSGLLSNTFEQNAAITSYVITPLSFLSGTFYSVTALPKFLQIVNYFNPFFYMIDGFRYCFTNHTDSNLNVGILFLLAANIIFLQS